MSHSRTRFLRRACSITSLALESYRERLGGDRHDHRGRRQPSEGSASSLGTSRWASRGEKRAGHRCSEEWEGEQAFVPVDATRARALVARADVLAIDCGDIMCYAKELTQQISKPTEKDDWEHVVGAQPQIRLESITWDKFQGETLETHSVIHGALQKGRQSTAESGAALC